MPKVSVIIPSYNLGQYLPETLKSVEAQTFEDWECLIVENGSTDGSMSVITEFCASDLRFVPVVFKENVGVAAARNRGLELAEGEYILFLDADDLIAPGYMAAAVAALDADPSLNLVYGRAERFGAETSWDLPPFSMDTMLARNCLYISCFFRRGQAPWFDVSLQTGFEDWDFWLSFLEQFEEPKVLQLPEVLFYYRTRRHSRNRGVTDELLKDIRLKLWDKHKALYAKYFCNPLETVEYRRLESSFRKASRWSLVWKLRMLFRSLFA
ncbi:MAG: glycosyltransferase family 2 protein [Bacteroidales bacterium]|nr:glycosyltransferase family 2 protein [Bacteroidales bacterium]